MGTDRAGLQSKCRGRPTGHAGLQGTSDFPEAANREMFIAGVRARWHRLVVGFRRAGLSLSLSLSEIGREESGRASVGGREAEVDAGYNVPKNYLGPSW